MDVPHKASQSLTKYLWRTINALVNLSYLIPNDFRIPSLLFISLLIPSLFKNSVQSCSKLLNTPMKGLFIVKWEMVHWEVIIKNLFLKFDNPHQITKWLIAFCNIAFIKVLITKHTTYEKEYWVKNQKWEDTILRHYVMFKFRSRSRTLS